jgi:UDP-2,3-diacylglucosamine pyrophosphatase LpxH
MSQLLSQLPFGRGWRVPMAAQIFAPKEQRHWPALFISDVHLGLQASRPDRLVDFLRHNSADVIYLVGDIVDLWALRDRHHWPQENNDVIQKLLRQARKGTRIVWIPGNHDEGARQFCGAQFGGIEIVQNAIHTTSKGRRYLVTHGDQYDIVVGKARLIARLGGHAYNVAVLANRVVMAVRRRLRLPYWSLAQWLKLKVKDAVAYIGDFEKALVAEAREYGVDGVICGHIHHATMHHRFGLHYINTGDWVEDCTAIVEREDGEFELIDWSDDQHVRTSFPLVAGGTIHVS